LIGGASLPEVARPGSPGLAARVARPELRTPAHPVGRAAVRAGLAFRREFLSVMLRKKCQGGNLRFGTIPMKKQGVSHFGIAGR
jgi:hypothetical protein